MKVLIFILVCSEICLASIPLVVNTWNMPNAAQKAWEVLNSGSNDSDNALDALTYGCNTCEVDEKLCGNSVGYGGSPDENGETTLDALIFDGDTMDMGAVGGLRRVKHVIAVARYVLDYTEHSLLVGDLATEFAKAFNFTEESLQANYSLGVWEGWKANNCQPNFWKNVEPDPSAQCGPYTVATKSNLLNSSTSKEDAGDANSENHDTIGMIVISRSGHVVAGTSTNGLTYKISGRVGDSPLPGAGAYADSDYGAAVATGNGDIMMRFLPTFLAVEQLRQGATPTNAARLAVSRIVEKYPSFSGAVIVADKSGNVGAACNGMTEFPFMVASEEYPNTELHTINCTYSSAYSFAKYSLTHLYYVAVLYVVLY